MEMPTYETLGYNSPDGMQIGILPSHKAAFYGAPPVAQRAASGLHAASLLSISSNTTIAASLTAWVLEVTATFKGLGIWP
jgi:hypothetical protein